MIASYRIIHFTPDPFVEARFPLGAVVQDTDGRVHVVQAKHLPSAACLGDAQLANAAQRLRAHLATITSTEALPPIFGPYTELGRRYCLPVEVGDPVRWVQGLFRPLTPAPDAALEHAGALMATAGGVAPHEAEVYAVAAVTGARAMQHRPESAAAPQRKLLPRAPIGFRVFEDRLAAQYVRRTFKPALDWRGWLGPQAEYLNEVSYWVEGNDQVLLMEPVVPGKNSFERDLKDVTTKFLAYRGLMEQRTEDLRQGTLVAFITPHGSRRQRRDAARAVSALTDVADDVVDTSERGELEDFLGKIVRIGATGTGQDSRSTALMDSRTTAPLDSHNE